MATPGKNFNYSSPYANALQQYPSQSEDYISLDMGGPNNSASSSEKTPGHNFKYYQQNYRNSSSKANRRSLFNNNYGQQNNRHSFNHQQRYGSRTNEMAHQQQKLRSNEKRQQQNHNNDKRGINSIASYLHPSMTEDPWFELEERIQALERSKISLNKISTTNKSPPPPYTGSNPSSDSGQEEDSAESD